MLLRKYHAVALANDAAAHAPCLGPQRKLILTAIVLMF